MTNSPITAPEFSFFWTLLQQLLDRESLSRNQAAELMQVGGAVELMNHAQGVSAAKDILQSGAAWAKLEQLVEFLGN